MNPSTSDEDFYIFLIQNLNQQISSFRGFSDLLRHEEKAIIDWNVKLMQTLAEKKVALSDQLSFLETQRLEFFKEKNFYKSLKDCSEHAFKNGFSEFGQQLDSLRRVLKALVQSIQNLNNNNKKLLESGGEDLRELMHFALSSGFQTSKPAQYNHKGEVTVSNQKTQKTFESEG